MIHKQISKNGFTLIELLVAVAVVGILAAIAIPSYQESMRKSRRSDAQGALLNFANGMERYYTQNNTYCDTGTTGRADRGVVAANTCGNAAINDTGSPLGAIFAPRGELDTFYTFTIFSAPPPGNTYTLRATPVVGQAQTRDGLMELDSTGVQRWDQNNDGDTADAGENSWQKH